MISRPIAIGVTGAVVIIAAVLLNYFQNEETPPKIVAKASLVAPAPASGGSAAGGSAAGGSAAGQGAAVQSPGQADIGSKTTPSGAPATGASAAGAKPSSQATTSKATVQPSFDVVRIDPEGNTVIAGRAAPNAKVVIRDGEAVLGEVTADGRGEWVFVPDARLEPGSRVLTLSDVSGTAGEALESENAVVLVIPEPGKDIAGADNAGDRTPLAMVVPRDSASAAASKIVQVPRVTTPAIVGSAPDQPKTTGAVASVVTPAAPPSSSSAGSTSGSTTTSDPAASAPASAEAIASGSALPAAGATSSIETKAAVVAPAASGSASSVDPATAPVTGTPSADQAATGARLAGTQSATAQSTMAQSAAAPAATVRSPATEAPGTPTATARAPGTRAPTAKGVVSTQDTATRGATTKTGKAPIAAQARTATTEAAAAATPSTATQSETTQSAAAPSTTAQSAGTLSDTTQSTATQSTAPQAVVAPSARAVRSYPEATTATAATSDQGQAPDQEKPKVALDTVDYDDKGKVVFSGKGEPGGTVQIYVDNKLAGQAKTDTAGRWTMQPKKNVEPGPHQIRVDQVADAGKVLARVQLPFVRARPFTDLPAGAIVIIQPGNNLWRIASRVYGTGVRYTEIYQANADQIRDPDLIYPGQVFGLPRTN